MYGNPDLNANQLPTQDLALGQAKLDSQVTNPFFVAGVITDPNSGLSGRRYPITSAFVRSLNSAVCNGRVLCRARTLHTMH